MARDATGRPHAGAGATTGEGAAADPETQIDVTHFVERRRGVRGALTGVLTVTRCAWRVREARIASRGD